MRDLQLPGRSTVMAPNGMAATSHPLSTQVAVEVLKAGGNAMDGAIAACAVQCVVEPESTGIGGDCFALYAPEGKNKVIAFNGSGRAPAAATVEKLAELGGDTIGADIPPLSHNSWCRRCLGSAQRGSWQNAPCRIAAACNWLCTVRVSPVAARVVRLYPVVWSFAD